MPNDDLPGETMKCEHGIAFSDCGPICCVKKTLNLLIHSETDICRRLRSQYGVTLEETRARHRLEAFQTALSCLPE